MFTGLIQQIGTVVSVSNSRILIRPARRLESPVIGESIDEREAKAYLRNLAGYGYLDDRALAVSVAAVSTPSLASAPIETRNKIRADLLKQIVLSLMEHR